MPRKASREFGQRVLVAHMQDHLFLMDGLVGAGEAVERHYGVIAVGGRAGLNVDELGLLLADLLQPFCHILVADLRLAIMHRDAAILAQLNVGSDFEFSLEAQRLAFVEMDVVDVGPCRPLAVALRPSSA